jgi:crotonobetainyl-CoA:carnitine CoA-transferase CaiB-like acyl-CoA transferase
LGAPLDVDGSTGLAAAYCAKLLGQTGCEVVFLEPTGGDPLRGWTCGGPPEDGRDGALFRHLRAGHRSVIVDDPAGWLQAADVVLSAPGGELGDPLAAVAANPDAVVLSFSPYGLTGPYRERPGTELTLQADGGALAGRGIPQMAPYVAGGQVVHWVAGAYGAAAGSAFLYGARRGTGGTLVDLSLQEVATLSSTLFADLYASMRGRPPLPGAPPRVVETPSIEPTADGWVGFTTNTRQQFENFLLLIEQFELMDGPADGWAMLQTRQARLGEWQEMVRSWTTRHPSAEIIERASELRIPVAPVSNAQTLLHCDHFVARQLFHAEADGPALGPRRPWIIDGQLPPSPQPAPALGASSEESPPSPATKSRQHDVEPGRPLTGLRVVDLTNWWAGPAATGLFALLGADVVHIEGPRNFDGGRTSISPGAPTDQWWERSAFYLQSNLDKRGITLDLGMAEGRDIALRLIADADLVIENFTPRVLENLQLGWEAISAVNPRAVMVRMPAFGLAGPWRDRPGFTQTMEQATGAAWLTGHPADQPRIQRGPCDPNAGMHAVVAALAGLEQRDATGRGCFVESAMIDTATAICPEPVLEWTAYGRLLGREGNRSPWVNPSGVYACAGHEQWLAIGCADDWQWQALTSALGRSDWATDSALADASGRRLAADELDAGIADWAGVRELGDALDVLVRAGVPAAAAVDPRAASEHPQLRARGMFELVKHPVAGAHLTPTLPFRASGVGRWHRTPAPTFGQHNAEVLSALGISAGELADLQMRGVVSDRPLGI